LINYNINYQKREDCEKLQKIIYTKTGSTEKKKIAQFSKDCTILAIHMMQAPGVTLIQAHQAFRMMQAPGVALSQAHQHIRGLSIMAVHHKETH